MGRRGDLSQFLAMVAGKISHEALAKVLVEARAKQMPEYESGGSITVLRPDGS